MRADVRITHLDLYLARTPILTGAETARLLGYSTTDALYKANQRGQLPFQLFKLPGRRGWFAATSAVKEWLESTLAAGSTKRALESEDVSRALEGGDKKQQPTKY